MTNNIHPDTEREQIRKLGTAVILQAFRDLKSRDITKALDAMIFFRGDDFQMWVEISGMPRVEFKIKTVKRAWRLMSEVNNKERSKWTNRKDSRF